MAGPAMGYPEGTLKQIAMGGVDGSQYVGPDTSPPSGPGDLTFPLRGVTYVELGLGQTWIGVAIATCGTSSTTRRRRDLRPSRCDGHPR